MSDNYPPFVGHCVTYDTDVGTDWLVKTPDGRLWSESGDMDWISSFDGQKWIPEFNTDNSLLDSPTTNTALVTSTGQILLGTDQGLFQYDPVLNSITALQLGQVDVKLIYETTDQKDGSQALQNRSESNVSANC